MVGGTRKASAAPEMCFDLSAGSLLRDVLRAGDRHTPRR